MKPLFLYIFIILLIGNFKAQSSEITNAIEKFRNGFSFSSSSVAFNAESIMENYKKNRPYCSHHKWNSAQNGEFNDVQFSKNVEITGENLRDHFVNTRPILLKLHRLILDKVSGVNDLASRAYLMGMVEANSFTNIVPHKFKFASDYSGKVILPDFPSGDEQITKTSMLMLATSLAVEINRENMSVKELEAIKRWGSILLKEHTNVENLSFDLEKSWGADSRSHIAAGYISLGISTKNKDMLNLGLDLLSYVLENDIDENGMYSNHWENHTHLGMEHQNVITAQLVNSAHILKNNGFDIYYLKNKKGSTLADAINFTIENAFENNSPKIKNLEVTRPYLDATRKVFNTLSWLELAGADNPEYLENLSFTNALEFRDTTATFVTESIAGFFGGNMPGYTSCYFSIKAPEVDVANKIKMMTFYQNTSFNQRQCLFKLLSPDLLVLFKSNETLPTKRLEERRTEGYLSCRNR